MSFYDPKTAQGQFTYNDQIFYRNDHNMLFVWSSSDFKWKPTHPNNIEYSSQVLAEKSNIQYSNLTMDPNPIIHLQDATPNLTPIKDKLNALKISASAKKKRKINNDSKSESDGEFDENGRIKDANKRANSRKSRKATLILKVNLFFLNKIIVKKLWHVFHITLNLKRQIVSFLHRKGSWFLKNCTQEINVFFRKSKAFL